MTATTTAWILAATLWAMVDGHRVDLHADDWLMPSYEDCLDGITVLERQARMRGLRVSAWCRREW